MGSSCGSSAATSTTDRSEPPDDRNSGRAPGVAHQRPRELSRFYSDLLQWRAERIDTKWGSYHALDLGSGLGGGIVECGRRRASWLPYVAVDRIEGTTELASRLGARVLLAPREGPAGWRAVLSTLAGGEIALWQAKRQLRKLA